MIDDKKKNLVSTHFEKTNSTASILYDLPDENFWSLYGTFWKEKSKQSVFKSPHYIRNLCEKYADKLACFQFHRGDELVGLVFFRKENGVYHFLSDVRADHNFFILQKDCSAEQLKELFQAFFTLVKREKWAMVLNNQPAWADYMNIFCEEGKKHGLFFSVSPFSVCPIVKGLSPENLLEHVNRPKIRYKINRLEKQQQAVFEVFTEEEELQAWVDGYCDLHIKRWAETNTPSKYHDKHHIEELKEWLGCWIKDENLARFSIRIGDKRIAYVVCLQEPDRLIHHTTAFDIAYYKYSPGIALILFIARWMQEKGFSILDFGEGDESYKFEFADETLELQRVFIANYSNLPFVMKAKLKTSLRNNARLLALYRESIKPLTTKISSWYQSNN